MMATNHEVYGEMLRSKLRVRLRLAAAERAVIDAADVYHQNPSLSNNAILRASVVAWRAVRDKGRS